MVDAIGDNTKAQLLALVGRIERLEEERSGLADDVREVYAEAKGVGLDPKILRKVIALRKFDKAYRDELETLITLYMEALDA